MKKLSEKYFRKFKILFRLILWKINKRIRNQFTVKTRQGIFRALFNDRVIGKSLYCKNEYELNLCLAVSKFLNSKGIELTNGTILDIGANIGVISIGMITKKLVKSAIAIEPDPVNYNLLNENIKLNKFDKIIYCNQYAASEKKGKVIFELSETNFGDHRIRTEKSLSQESFVEKKRKTIEVNIDKIDNLILMAPFEFYSNIKVIWMDVQGHEGFVIKGGNELFSKRIPLVLEICPYLIERSGMSTDEFKNILSEFWTDIWLFRRNKFVKYPLTVLTNIFEEIGNNNHQEYENILLL